MKDYAIFYICLTASAFVLRGATPVFVDIDVHSLNIDIKVKQSITAKTKAVVVVHYAGVAHNRPTFKSCKRS